MGRLFWKFFLFVWVAQLAGIVAVALLFWATQPRFIPQVASIDAGPGARTWVGAAAEILRYGGVEAFKSWASSDMRHPVYAVDAGGDDLLGRAIPSSVIAQARSMHANDPSSPLVLSVTDSSQHDLLLFAARGEGPTPGAAPEDRPPARMVPPGAAPEARRPVGRLA